MDIRERGGSPSSLPKGGNGLRVFLAVAATLFIAGMAAWMMYNRQETIYPSFDQLPAEVEQIEEW